MGVLLDKEKQEKKLQAGKGFSKSLVSVLGQTDWGTRKGAKKAEKVMTKC